MPARLRAGLVLLCLCGALAACADSDRSSDQDRNGTFYGGVIGGTSLP